jgi:hypothetical protein
VDADFRQAAARTTPLHASRSPIFRARAVALIVALMAIALPTAALAAGNPTAPAGGAAATTTTPTTPTTGKSTIHWRKPVRIEKAKWGGLNAISCPAVHLCLAVDQSGHVLWTQTPKSTKHWHLVTVDKDKSLTGISCPTATFCAAVDDAGRLVWTSTPTGNKKKWSKPEVIDTALAPGGGPAGLTAISCTVLAATPTTTTTTTPTTPSKTSTKGVTPLCVATDGSPQGNVVVSTKPTGGKKAWIPAQIGSANSLGGTLASVTCLSMKLCVAAGSQHYYSKNPAGGKSAWKATGGPTAGGLLASVACPAANACVAVGYGNSSIGLSDVTSRPTGGLTSWITTAVTGTPPAIGAGLVDGVGCSSVSFCIAVDGFDHAYTTTSPLTGAWAGGDPIRKNSAAQWSSIACQPTYCMVVDSAGVGVPGVIKIASTTG